MPFTPLHLGPGIAVKSIFGRMSFTVFAVTQVVIDLEPLVLMYRGEWPIHRLFHTCAGATLAAVIGLVAGRPFCRWLLGFWNRRLSAEQARWLFVEPDIPWPAAVQGAFIGAYSHVFLDAFMHADMEPLAPFATGNRLVEWLTIPQLHGICLITGAAGLALMAVSRWRFQRSDDR